MAHPPALPRRDAAAGGLHLPILLPALLAGILLGAPIPGLPMAGAPAEAQEPGEVAASPADTVRVPPADTWADEGTRLLLERARARRGQVVEGLDSYEARMRERIYIGLDGRTFRRERGILSEERLAWIRWSATGERRVAWEAARRDVDLAGLSSAVDTSMARGLARDLGSGRLPPPLLYDPGSDRIAFGEGQFALDPLADTAGFHYRFQPGDTLRITLPEVAQPLTLAEVRVQPRRSEFRLVAASLWFDTSSGALVRAVYRPARPFDLSLDGDEDAPRFLGAVRGEIRVVSVDHGLYDLQWWIPRRFLFEGEVTVGGWVRVPLQVDWELSEVEVNEPPSGFLADEEAPEGWTTVEAQVLRRSRGDSVRVVRVIPPAGDLITGIPPRVRGRTWDPDSFSPGELRDLEARLAGLLPAPALGRLEWGWGLGSGMTRFNRIEGLATGIRVRTLLPGSREVAVGIRAGTHALEPTAELRLRGGDTRRGWDVGLYRRLEGASHWHDAGALGASLGNALNGEGPTPWYRSWGGSVATERGWGAQRARGELFAERHGAAEVGTGGHLRRIWGRERSAEPNIEAREGGWLGVRGVHRWQSGVDPSRVRLFVTTRVEGATLASSYGRGSTQAGVVVPLAPRWAAALEVGGGGAVGDLPVQRWFYPGGAESYRALAAGEVATQGFGLARAELGRGFSGARLVGFVDLLAPREVPDPRLGAGVGASFLDGLVRVEVARELQPSHVWRYHLYLDALF